MAIETIKYQVLKKEDNIEIRAYDEILLASTKTSLNDRNNSGFNRVFKYITGENHDNKQISMTSPVVTYQEENQIITGFYVPSIYDKITVPRPKGDVFINTIEPSQYVVITFYGAWNQTNYDTHHQLLIHYINQNKLKTISQPFIMRYNAPYVPDAQKRNEIAYQIKSFNP